MSARETRWAGEVRSAEEATGIYLVQVSIRWAPGYRAAALRALSSACLDALVRARGEAE